MMNTDKYRPYPTVALSDRQWPSRSIDSAPIWCSVDLRDGNQALIEPMDTPRKSRLFTELVKLGFKEIEVGFPSASQTDYDFLRHLIERDMIPDDVTIQVLTQCRDHLIERTYKAITGAKNVIVHIYNSTSELQRRVVFKSDQDGITEIATKGAALSKALAEKAEANGTRIVHQYSPESFTGTELDYAKEICEAVMDVWQPTPENKCILNLPATVEMATPNVYADQIEWFHRNCARRDSYILSVHPHNDRGTGVAATELAVMAGAERIEGTLFGNGERTGNVDIVTLALNLYTQGVDSGLVFEDIDALRQTVEYCNQLPVHPRHPYAGELVFTAFSGSHQDAIKKGMDALKQANSLTWEVPYLPIDPQDLGRSYEAVIRINSQSGKGGVAYIMKTEYKFDLPRPLQIAFSQEVQKLAEESGKEITPEAILARFESAFMNTVAPLAFHQHTTKPDSHASEMRLLSASITHGGKDLEIEGRGNGPIAAYMDAINTVLEGRFRVLDYREHAIDRGSDAEAVAYVEIDDGSGSRHWGAAIHANIVTASLKAVTAAVNRALN